jgi:hypothetical protein
VRWPRLVREARTPCKVTVWAEGIGEDGSPVVALDADLVCNYQSRARTVRTKDGTAVEVSGTCLFDGDICPGVAELAGGEVSVFGERRAVALGSKARNPDGTVNHTRLELV